MEEKEKVALFLCQAKGKHSRLVPQELCPLPWGIGRGYIVRTQLPELCDKDQGSKVLHSSSAKFQKGGVVNKIRVCVRSQVVRVSFLKIFIYLFIYFWLHRVFIAACELSLFVASRGYSSLWCTGFMGFSLRWLLLLQGMGSRCTGFSSCGMRASVVVAHGL